MHSILYDLYCGKLPRESRALLHDPEYLTVQRDMHACLDELEALCPEKHRPILMRLEALYNEFLDLHEATGFAHGFSLGQQLTAAAFTLAE